jgi:hypothetical protein
MNFPAFSHVQFVKKDGFLTEEMQDYNDLINQALINGLSDSGWTVAPITAANLVLIAPSMPNGTIWYDSTNREWVGRQDDGAGGYNLVKFTTTPYP